MVLTTKQLHSCFSRRSHHPILPSFSAGLQNTCMAQQLSLPRTAAGNSTTRAQNYWSTHSELSNLPGELWVWERPSQGARGRWDHRQDPGVLSFLLPAQLAGEWRADSADMLLQRHSPCSAWVCLLWGETRIWKWLPSSGAHCTCSSELCWLIFCLRISVEQHCHQTQETWPRRLGTHAQFGEHHIPG